MVEAVLQDVRFALRHLRNRPGFSATALLMLALGLGASAAIFAFVDAALLKPLPFRDAGRLVWTTETAAMMGPANLSWPDYQDWQRSARSFESLAVWRNAGYLLQAEGVTPEPAIRVSANFLHTLGVAPARGRDFQPDDNLVGSAKVVMLTWAVWQQQYGGRADLIGKSIRLDSEPYTVIGVLPQEFRFAPRGALRILTAFRPEPGSCDAKRSCHSLNGVGRLREGVTVAEADDEVKAIAARLAQQYPASNRGQGGMAKPLAEYVTGKIRPVLYLLLSGAVLLFLIGSLNVASLLLARSEDRSREFAVRGALGATRSRLVRQFAVESLLLVGAGSGLGLWGAAGLMRLLFLLIPAEMRVRTPFLAEVHLSRNTCLFAAAEALLAAMVFAAVPLLRMSFTGLRGALASGSRASGSLSWRRIGSQLVVLEVSTAVVLLVGAGLLSRSLLHLLQVDMGFRTDHLATLRVALPNIVFNTDAAKLAVEQQVAERFRRIPGVTSVAFGDQLPGGYNGNTEWIRFVGKPYDGHHNEVNDRNGSPTWFATLGAHMVRGRSFDERDMLGKQRVVVINQKFAEEYYPGEDPIGKVFGNADFSPDSMRQIIGVVNDMHEGNADDEVWAAEYEPAYQQVNAGAMYAVRVSGSARAMLPQLAAAVKEVDRNLGTAEESTMEDMIHDSQSSTVHRGAAWLVSAFALVALLLCVVGLYGVVMYSVSLRTREFGVRMALGSPRRALYELVLREAGTLSVAGVTLGIALALGAAMLLRSLLFQVSVWDAPTLLCVVLLVGCASLGAGVLPAYRATMVDPASSLRTE